MRFRCEVGETTLSLHASHNSDCVCAPGYSFELGRCRPCDTGYYKPDAGSSETCTPCHLNLTTFNLGATSNASCVQESAFSEDADENAADAAEASSFSNTSTIPTVEFSLSFNMPESNFA